MSQEERICEPGALVLYKKKPAKVTAVDAKIHLQLENAKTVQVREKDITVLHPGKLNSLGELESLPEPEEDLAEVCEMLEETSDIAEFAELAYGEYTPVTAWAVCGLLEDGLFITGEPGSIIVVDPAKREAILAERREKAEKQAAWEAFIARVKARKLEEGDRTSFFDVENLAYGKSPVSRLLKELKISEDPEHAHEFLLKMGIWDEYIDPFPSRMGVSTDVSYPEIGEMEAEERIDLTHLAAYAIDDEGSKDPDDAVSIDGDRLWVHVADVSAAVTPGSEADLEAKELGSNLYLPNGVRTMLHPDAAEIFGMGLNETSPAFSFGIVLDGDGEITDTQVCLSTVKVTRLTYGEAQERMAEPELASIWEFVERYRKRRAASGAIELNIPEVKTRVDEEGIVSITPIVPHQSRELVGNAMIMAGEAAARFAVQHEIPFPFTVQMPPDVIPEPAGTITEMFKMRRKFRPSELRLSPDVHSGLGVHAYSRVTSPLRRYLDLLAHQQLRAYLQGSELLDEEMILERGSIAFEGAKQMQRVERESTRHWKLVYLLQNPGWTGTGVVFEIHKKDIFLFIEELAMEVSVPAINGVELDEELQLTLEHVNIPYRTASFSAERRS